MLTWGFFLAGLVGAGLLFFFLKSHYGFQTRVEGKIIGFTEDSSAGSGRPVLFAVAEDLPEPVKRYFTYAIRDRKEKIRFLRLEQTGLFRNKYVSNAAGEKGWKSIRSEQYIDALQPGFFWAAKLHLGPLIHLSGWDEYRRGKGHVLWKLLSALTLVDLQHPEIDQSCLIRFLAEAPWYPTALLPGDRLSWKPVGADAAEATIRDRGLKASAVFHFSPEGKITHVLTRDKAREVGVKVPWTQRFGDYQEIDGMRVPMEIEASWNLPAGDFTYARFRLKRVEYDPR